MRWTRLLLIAVSLLAMLPGGRAAAQEMWVTGAVLGAPGKAHLFLSDGSYIRHDLARNQNDDGYPKPVDDKSWPGMGRYASSIMTACNGPNGKIYFFLNDGRYVRFDIKSDRVDQAPQAISDRTWPGMGRYATSIQSAVAWKDNKIMFFLSDGRYVRYDIGRDRVDDGYPKAVDDKSWPGLARHRSSLGGMLNMGNGKVYMFLNTGDYLRYDVAADRVESGYPKPVRRQLQ